MRASHPRLIESVLVLLCLIGMTSGCTMTRPDLMRNHMGVRPDEPDPTVKLGPCEAYREYVKYAQQLQEAYHSRASQNRWWLYVAGVLGLGAAAASGGLAAAGAAGVGTLALLGISGGFAAGTFGTLNNPELAKMYSLSATSVDKAVQRAEARASGVTRLRQAQAKDARLKKLVDDAEKAALNAADAARQAPGDAAKQGAKQAADAKLLDLRQAKHDAETELNAVRGELTTPGPGEQARCLDAVTFLRAELTKARDKLELLRTDNASGALARAQAEKEKLDEIIKDLSPKPDEPEEETTAPTK
jgi:hypothetical protein